MKRDTTLKPRKEGNRTPEDLRRILSGIYPQEMVDDLMKNLGYKKRRKEQEHEEKTGDREMSKVRGKTQA